MAVLACPYPCRGRGDENIKGRIFKKDGPKSLWKWPREGFLYTRLKNGRVMCGICPNRCVLDKGDRSVCRSRVNVEGTLYTLCYGNPCSLNVDPMEKKPLFHFHPGTSVFSLSTTGCNFRCLNCQNWQISQARPEDVRHYDMFPSQVVAGAGKYNASSIAYTYAEATTYFEYMRDIAKLAGDSYLNNIYISNGYINKEPLLELVKVLHAANINLKSYSDDIYHRLNGGRLSPVLDTLACLHDHSVHLEITNLVVPGYNDSAQMVKKMCEWIVSRLGPDHPVHFIRFFPQYKLDRLPPTPVPTLEIFRKIAMDKGIRYVYMGNVPNHEGGHTYCHNCGRLLIRRMGYTIPEYHIDTNVCEYCRTVIPGIWA